MADINGGDISIAKEVIGFLVLFATGVAGWVRLKMGVKTNTESIVNLGDRLTASKSASQAKDAKQDEEIVKLRVGQGEIATDVKAILRILEKKE